MKRFIFLIICLSIALIPTIYSQNTTKKVGLSLENYQLPTTKSGFTNFSTSNYYQPVFDKQKKMPTVVVNNRQLKKDNLLYLLAISLNSLNVGGTNNFGSIGLPSPAFDPLVSDLSGPNDYLLLQQHEFQRKNTLPVFIAAPRALQLRF